jgi:hypothetical protein
MRNVLRASLITLVATYMLFPFSAPAQPAAAVPYRTFNGQTLSLYPWTGKKIVVLTANPDLDVATMQSILNALDAAWNIYEMITSADPVLYPPTSMNGKDIVAEVPDGATCGAACSYIGFTGTEIATTYFNVLYNGVRLNNQFDQVLFYEFGRNFWFYGDQLGKVDPFVTGFAIANRFISMDRIGVNGGPFGALPYTAFERLILSNLMNSYLTNPAYNWANTLGVNQAPPTPNSWGATDLAGGMIYRIYSDSGMSVYTQFWNVLKSLSAAPTPDAAIQNFVTAAKAVTGADYSFLFKTNAPTGRGFAGSTAKFVSGGGWDTRLTLVNGNSTSSEARVNFLDDQGNELALPLAFPQKPSSVPLVASTFDQTLTGNSLLVIDSQQPNNPNTQAGSLQLFTAGNVGGFAIFKYMPSGQEAVVPLETRNAPSYVLAFDNTGALVTGVAIGNVAAQPANIRVVIRDDTGTQISTDTISLPAQGHTSFMLTSNYAITTGKRGTIELDTPLSGRITVLGLRANGGALTSVPALADVTIGGGSIAQVASGGGWQTTFTLVNTGTSSSQAQLRFFDNNGNPLALPLILVQSGTAMTTSTISQTIAAGATLLILTQGSNALVGSAQLTTPGSVSCFAIFRYNPTGQEAVVPLETRNANAYDLAFDNTNGVVTGLALANYSNQTANVPVLLRDDTGASLGTSTLSLAANGHTSFVLTDNYAFAAGKRGTVEFDVPAGLQISALGLRSTPTGAITTIPVLAQ